MGGISAGDRIGRLEATKDGQEQIRWSFEQGGGNDGSISGLWMGGMDDKEAVVDASSTVRATSQGHR
jgi:hypothetical protein